MKTQTSLALLIICVFCAGSAFAQQALPPLPPEAENSSQEDSQDANWINKPRSINPGDILLNGAFTVGRTSVNASWIGNTLIGYTLTGENLLINNSKTAFGFSLAIDYTLKNNRFTVGAESGYSRASFYGDSVGTLPILLRFGYHFNVNSNSLDLYILAKAGLAMEFVFDNTNSGFGFGINAGGRYFFNNNLAFFAELGYDRNVIKESGIEYYESGYLNYNYIVTAVKFLSLGLTYRLALAGHDRKTQTLSSLPPPLPPAAQEPPPLPVQAAQTAPALPPAPKYTLVIGGKYYGPYEMEQLRKAVQQGSMTKNTFVWKEGMTQWQTAGTVRDLESLFR